MADPFLGEIRMIGCNFAPRGWALCNGQLLEISEYPALFALLSTYYGGDGRTYFAVPDLRGRVPVHQGHGQGLSDYRLGQSSGWEQMALYESMLPPHTHEASVGTLFSKTPASTGDADSPAPSEYNDSVLAVGNFKYGKDNVAAKMYNTANADHTLLPESLEGQIALGDTGASAPFLNIPPSLTVNFIISLEGIFPPRN